MPPVNDNFASATVLSGSSGHLTFSNVGATTETGEPDNAEGRSVWFKWTPAIDGDAYVRTGLTPLPDWDSYIAVHTGTSLADLVEVASADDNDRQAGHTDPYGTSKATWTATAGTTYWIQVTTFDDVSGPVERADARLDWAIAALGIDSIAPTTGPVGTVVDVYGGGFGTVTGVTINTIDQSWSYLGPDHIQVTIQSGTTTGYIVLARSGGDLTSPVRFTVGDPPQLDAILLDENYSGYPSPGVSNAGLVGDVLRLTGIRLNTVTDVLIGGAPASFTSEVVSGDTVLHATIPAAAATGTVEVANSIGSASRPFTRLYPGPWIQPPSRWSRDFINSDCYNLAWQQVSSVDAVPAEPGSDFDGTVLTDNGLGENAAIRVATDPMRVARTSSGTASDFNNDNFLDEWVFEVLESVFVLNVLDDAEFYGHDVMPPTEPSADELAPADVYSWQFEPGTVDAGNWRHGEPDPNYPILANLSGWAMAEDRQDFYAWDNQWRNEVTSGGWGIRPAPLTPFTNSPPRSYHVDVPDSSALGHDYTLQWVNNPAAPIAAYGSWITFAPTSLDFPDRYFTGATWDPAVIDPTEVRLLRRPTGGGTIDIATTWPVVDARNYRTVESTDILTDLTWEWRYADPSEYAPNPDTPSIRTTDFKPVKKWYTSSDLAAHELLASYTVDDDYPTVEGRDPADLGGSIIPDPAFLFGDHYNPQADLKRGLTIVSPAGTPDPYITAAENDGFPLVVDKPVLIPFDRLDANGRLGVIAAPKRVREWSWPALPDYHIPAADTWFTDADYWQGGSKFIWPLSLDGNTPFLQFLFKHKPPRYRLLYTSPPGGTLEASPGSTNARFVPTGV